jgi:hypothetical protein
VKGIAKALAAGIVIEAFIGLLSAATFSMLFAVFLWPGFLITNYAYRLLGYQGIGFENFNWILWPALVINVVLYAGVYALAREVVTRGRRRRLKS